MNPMMMGGIASGIGSIIGSQMGGDYKNPADSAMGYLNQIPGAVKPYYDPYINAGKESLSTLMNQYNTLLSDPNAIMNLAGSGFQQSPGYQFQYNQGMNAANSAAGAGGMLGTPYHQQNAASMATNLANQDYYNYLNKTLGLYDTGLQGMGGINQMGYNASTGMADTLANSLMNQANMSYLGTSNQNLANAQKGGNMLSGLTSIGAGFL